MISKTIAVSLWSKCCRIVPVAALLSLITLQACNPTKGITESKEDYYEDLTAYLAMPEVDSAQLAAGPIRRPAEPQAVPDGEPATFTHDVTAELQHYIDTVAAINSKNPYMSGYTVQVYTGSDRNEAYDAKEAVYMVMPDADPEVTYEQPVYKVKVGWYRERLEAERVYLQLHRKIASTIVIPERRRK